MFLCSFFSTERYRTVFSIKETDSYQMRFGIAFVFSLTLPPFFPSIKMKGKVWNFWCKCDNIFRMCIKRYQFSDDCSKKKEEVALSFLFNCSQAFLCFVWKAMESNVFEGKTDGFKNDTSKRVVVVAVAFVQRLLSN